MKHRILQITLLALTALLILGLAPRWGDAQASGGPEIKWAPDIKIPSAKDLGAFKLSAKILAQKEFVALSNKIVERVEPNTFLRKKVDLDQTKALANRVAWVNKEDPSSFITQDSNNGDLLFQNQLRRYAGLTKVQLPTQQEAMNKAVKFIEDVGLMPTDFKTNGKLLHAGGLFAQDFNEGVAGEKSQKLVILHYGRELNGVAVQGPGSKMTFQLGDQGQIIALDKKWNAVSMLSTGLSTQMYNPKPLPPPSGKQLPGTAKEIERRTIIERRTLDPSLLKVRTNYLTESEVKEQINKDIKNDWTTADLVEVKDVDLVYYDRDGNYIQAAFAVVLKITWNSPGGDQSAGSSLDFLYHVAALRNPPEAIYETAKIDIPMVQQTAAPPTAKLLELAGPGD